MTGKYVVLDDVKYVTFDESAAAAITALSEVNESDPNSVASAIKNALIVAAKTHDGLLFEIASRANEEFAVKYRNVAPEVAKSATATLKSKFEINPLQLASIEVVLD